MMRAVASRVFSMRIPFLRSAGAASIIRLESVCGFFGQFRSRRAPSGAKAARFSSRVTHLPLQTPPLFSRNARSDTKTASPSRTLSTASMALRWKASWMAPSCQKAPSQALVQAMKLASRGKREGMGLSVAASPCASPSKRAASTRGAACSSLRAKTSSGTRSVSAIEPSAMKMVRSARSERAITSPTLVRQTGRATSNKASSLSV